MGSMAPDWRVVGAAPVPDAGLPSTDTRRTSVSSRHVAWAAAALLAALVAGAMTALLLMPGTGGVVVAPAAVDGAWTDPVPGGAAQGVVTDLPRAVDVGARVLVVDVEGAVAHPGLVPIPSGARVGDAIELAGGFAADADLAAAAGALNLAQPVTDGLKIVVPAVGHPGGGDAGMPPDGPSGPVDLNRATEQELDGLPGVGPATIAKIVTARQEQPFASVDELRARGIVGEATFDKLRDLVTVGR